MLLSLDLEKAFDKLDHVILVEKLHHLFNFSVTARNLMHSYLLERKQYVNCGGVQSSICAVKSGVPQGSVLGPLLFIMYVNDLFDRVICKNCRAFADDLQLVYKCDLVFLDVLQNTIDFTINVLNSWRNDNRLLLNPHNSKILFWSSAE